MAFAAMFIFTVTLFLCRRWGWGIFSAFVTLAMLLN